MSKGQWLMFLGVLVVIIPLLFGLPSSWNEILLAVIGLAISSIAYTLVQVPDKSTAPRSKSLTFEEHHGRGGSQRSVEASSATGNKITNTSSFLGQ